MACKCWQVAATCLPTITPPAPLFNIAHLSSAKKQAVAAKSNKHHGHVLYADFVNTAKSRSVLHRGSDQIAKGGCTEQQVMKLLRGHHQGPCLFRFATGDPAVLTASATDRAPLRRRGQNRRCFARSRSRTWCWPRRTLARQRSPLQPHLGHTHTRATFRLLQAQTGRRRDRVRAAMQQHRLALLQQQLAFVNGRTPCSHHTQMAGRLALSLIHI